MNTGGKRDVYLIHLIIGRTRRCPAEIEAGNYSTVLIIL